VIERGVRDGKSNEDIGRQLLYGILDPDLEKGDASQLRARARMIARTETAMIYEGAKEQAWKQSGIVKGKQWLLAAGGCEFCTALAGPQMGALRPDPIPLDAAFIGGGVPLIGTQGGKMTTWRAVRTAPLHPNCRCGTTEILIDEDVDLDMREFPG